MTRHDGRPADQLRPISVQRGFTRHAEGSYLYSSGNTIVLCTASIEPRVPPWLEGKGKGWVTELLVQQFRRRLPLAGLLPRVPAG